jgi:diaminohydroxyphosphoribosylaminopyrimidine deaminase/5-amino-6-(5-phosphoribosylamino)uracil reductase
MLLNHDAALLLKALELAQIRRGFCAPNPAVGALVVRDEAILATGHHYGPGSSHAEVNALNKLPQGAAHEATVYVTLEPCCHFGRTPPCTDRLIEAGVKRVVYGFRDPNPIVAGNGHIALEKAGIQAEQIPLPEIDAFYQSYQYWHLTQKPFVKAKIALSLDGKIADKSGAPIAITGAELREYTHFCRKHSDAILTTAKTVIADDPQMNARVENEIISKDLYILDSALTLHPSAKVFTTAQSVTIFHAYDVPSVLKDRFIAMGVRCISVDKAAKGLVLEQVIAQIGKDGKHDIWIEAGGQCFSTFISAQLVQRAYIYVAPLWVGVGLAAFADNFNLEIAAKNVQWRQYGKDVLCEIHW